jgi:iron complex transport system substrate-binding protein
MTARVNRLLAQIVSLCLLIFVLSAAPAAAQDEASGPVTVVDAYGEEVVIEDASRIISIGGAVTETIYALGLGDNIIAVDESSIYPAAAFDLPQIGYLRFLSAEPILAYNPTLIIATDDAGPPEVVQQLRDVGVTFLIVPAEDTLEGAIDKLMTIAAALDRVEAGQALVDDMRASVADAGNLVSTLDARPRVMFLFLRGMSVLGVSGAGTGADEMIRLAGAENAVTSYEGYQPLTAEAVVAAAPDVILVTTNGIDSIDGLDALLELPGVAQTPAAQNGRIIASMDDLYLLGFTSRMGDAIIDLTYLVHTELPRPLPIVARLRGDSATLVRALQIAGQWDMLSGEGPFTVFAPQQSAFDDLPPGLLEGLFSSPISVQAVIGFHIVPDLLTYADLLGMDGESLPTLLGTPLSVTVEGDTVFINGVAIAEPDVMASNGVLHYIDGVLLPERP